MQDKKEKGDIRHVSHDRFTGTSGPKVGLNIFLL